MVDFELVLEIVHAPDPAHAKGKRDRAVLATLFGGGLRRSEIVALRLGDVRKTSNGTTFLYLRYTKAKKDAEQALPEWAATLLAEYVSERRAEGADEADFLFIGYTGRGGKTPSSRPISDSGVYHLFRSYCLRVGAGQFVTPHSARATAITKLLTDGISHREVQAFSRHSSIQMVELYDKRRFDVEKSPAKGLTYKRRSSMPE
jgi:integrase